MARLGAGKYRDRVIILTRSLAAADATGEEVESWPDPPANTKEHWAEFVGVGGYEAASPIRASYRAMTLRFRHEVEIEAVDKVKVKATGDTWTVTGVWTERREEGSGLQTVCTVIG